MEGWGPRGRMGSRRGAPEGACAGKHGAGTDRVRTGMHLKLKPVRCHPPIRSCGWHAPATWLTMGVVLRLYAPSKSTNPTVPSGRLSGWYSLQQQQLG